MNNWPLNLTRASSQKKSGVDRGGFSFWFLFSFIYSRSVMYSVTYLVIV